MTLSALIKKGGLTGRMTATVATPATQETDKALTVAPVATVAVAKPPESTPELTSEYEAKIYSWLEHIGESDLEQIERVLDKCRRCMDARNYVIKQWMELPSQPGAGHFVKCEKCSHFSRIAGHPQIGNCAVDEPESIVGLYGNEARFCAAFSRRSD